MKSVWIGMFLAILFAYGLVSQYDSKEELPTYHQMMEGK